MRLFNLIDLQYLVLAIFLGLAAVVLVYLGFQSYAFSRMAKDEKIEEEYPDGIEVQNHRIPPFLLFVMIGFFLWAIAYIVLYGLRGEPF